MNARRANKLEQVKNLGLTFYRSEHWRDLRHGIFTRHGGVSISPWRSLNLGASIGDDRDAVQENHRRMYRAANVNGGRAASCWLVHSTDTVTVNGAARDNLPLRKADALITDQPDTPLVMRYADCVPLLLYDRRRGAIGLGHAGWRGTVKGMAAKMVRAMNSAYACRPHDIEALIGPAISCRNYPVGADVAALATAYFGEAADVIHRDPADESPRFDLWRANRLDLQRSGVDKVRLLDICTYENTGDFYSHRAEKGATGRFGVVISL